MMFEAQPAMFQKQTCCVLLDIFSEFWLGPRTLKCSITISCCPWQFLHFAFIIKLWICILSILGSWFEGSQLTFLCFYFFTGKFLLSPYLNFWNFIVFKDICFVVQLILCVVFFTPIRKKYHIKAVRHNEMQLVWIPNNDSEPEETEEFSTVIRLFYS